MRQVFAVASLAILAGCTSAATSSSTAASAPSSPATQPAAATSSAPAGCDRAPLVMSAVRTQIANSQIAAAASRLREFAKTLPYGTLRNDVNLALVDLDRFNLDAIEGNPVNKDSKDFAQSFRAIADYCATSS